MSAMGRYFFELQEQEQESELAHIHNLEKVSEEEQYQIDKYEEEVSEGRFFY
jgi:hypothetical protein